MPKIDVVSRESLFNRLDEANGYLRSEHTRYRNNWLVVRNRAQDAIDRLGTPHTPTLKEYQEIMGLCRRTRVLEGAALDKPAQCQGRTRDGRRCRRVGVCKDHMAVATGARR
jgi:hypothetical protein